jgi:multiple sugar transport system permease protein
MTASARAKPLFKRGILLKLFAHLFLFAGGLIMIYPLVFIVLSAFFTPLEFNNTDLGFFPIAKQPTWQNIQTLFFIGQDKNTLIYYRNTILRTVYGTFNACITSLLAGYAFSRLRFKGREPLFLFFLATTMLPGIFSIMPTYYVLYRFPFAGGNAPFSGGHGLYDSVWVYVLLNGPVINIMGTFLVKQTLQAMPASLEEAAKIDGANTARVIFQIVLPTVRAVVAYVAITNAIGLWNDWQVPFFFTRTKDLQVIASALSRMTRYMSQEGLIPNYPGMMTLSLMLIVPSSVIFFIFQKNIVQGLISAGIKG